MKKFLFVLAIALLPLSALPSQARDVRNVFQRYNKVIWIDQENQVGAAYGRGRKLLDFPIMTGDDETPTPAGTYVINKKVINYYSRKYDTPMPYSLFFDYRGRAIHEGDVPDPEEQEEWATHGCIHVEQPYMKWLYNWAENGKTVVVVRGHRVWTEEEKPEEEEIQEAQPQETQEGEEQLREDQEGAEQPQEGQDEETEE